jgi:hypothetical protein
MKMKRRNLLKLGLLALSLALSAALAEIVLRLFYPTPYYGYKYIPPQEQLFQYDAVLGWKGRPDATGIFASADFRVSVTHDRYGYRNATPPFVHGKKSILVLGDSFGWGWGVEDAEVFSSYLTSRSRNINLYNLSAPGYGTDQEYLTLKQFLEAHDPLVPTGVFLLFYFNDFQDVLDTVRYSYPKPRFVVRDETLVLENVPVPDLRKSEYDKPSRDQLQLHPSLLRHSQLYNLFHKRGDATLRTIFTRPSGPAVPAPESRTNHALTVLLLRHIEALCKQRGMFFHVILLMTANTYEADRREMERLRAELETMHIEHSDFLSRTFPSTDLWLDGHLSKYGHEVLGSHVQDVLRKKGI